MTAAERQHRTDTADRLCREAYRAHGGPGTGVALVAVGGYGRGELAPYSDLDVVLVHEDVVDPGALAAAIWYPLWDSGFRIDHSVRSLSQMVQAADGDLKVALGQLDLRHLAGDPNLTLRLRATVLADWRRTARRRLPELASMVDRRHALVGEMAHSSVPDLKEAVGGLRDACVLKGLVATWLVDVPHVELDVGRRALLDVRDLVQGSAGRPVDRIAPEMWDVLAPLLGLATPEAAQRHVRQHGRRIAHLSKMTWRRVEGVLARPARLAGPRRPRMQPVAPGLALSAGELVWDGRVDPDLDPLLLLRAAAEAAEREVVLGPATVERLTGGSGLSEPWPEEARNLLIRLLASGRGLLAVWETLEETGGLRRILPEWERIRLLPHASTIHRFTVDRHVIETCIEASRLIRRVSRPDLLMFAALLHDIGKGGIVEHCIAGEPLARSVAARIGLDSHDIDTVGTLVRWHLLLPEIATSRDLEDPTTIALVTDRVGDTTTLDLLAALTEADCLATSPQAWTSWRAGLIGSLVAGVTVSLNAAQSGLAIPRSSEPEILVPEDLRDGKVQISITLTAREDGTLMRVVAPDRIGLLADVAAALGLLRVHVRRAKAWEQDDWGVSLWEVADQHLDVAILRQRLEAIVAGRLEMGTPLVAVAPESLDPVVVVHADASTVSTVLEVRAADGLGVLFEALRAVAGLGITVRSAHVDTVGPQAVDVFYLQEVGASRLADDRAATAAHAVRAALSRSSESAPSRE